jgi:transcriptional regulator with XRE-family HTH domain
MDIGKKIRSVIKQQGMTTSEFARRLCTTNQNVHDIYKRTSIDTAQLERIGEILNHDFFQYYVKPTSPLPLQKKTSRVFVEVEIDDDLKETLKNKLLEVFD